MRTVPTLLALLAIPLILQGEEQAGQPASLSPDRKWEYRATDEKAVLMRAGSDEQVLDLGDENRRAR